MNDTLGHDVGDRVLRHVAAQLNVPCATERTVERIRG